MAYVVDKHPKYIDWQKDAVDMMWSLSCLGWEKHGFHLGEEEKQNTIESLKENVARLCRLTTQKTGGSRRNISDLNFDTGRMTITLILIAATRLCLDESIFGKMPEKIESDELTWD